MKPPMTPLLQEDALCIILDPALLPRAFEPLAGCGMASRRGDTRFMVSDAQ